MSGDSHELLEAFKAAALSVTKLYKTSAVAQAKSRADGYQDCIEDLLAFLDKENIGHSNGEASRIRKWAMDRLEGRDTTSPPLESDDEAEKTDLPTSSPEVHRAAPPTISSTGGRDEVQMRDSAPPVLTTAPRPSSPIVEELDLVVPTLDRFSFQSTHPYPQLANLDISDSNRTTPRSSRRREREGRVGGPRTALGRGAGQKRKNLAEYFDINNLDLGGGNFKDAHGGGKRSRHA
ncbi:hypothetical protein QBC35DRAFT_36578 [Podospora australis]|uniref:Uncharacterized protein n=1 Tax=Podospora australis TaxID=1536484 RepID=A0AAN6X4B2_9PEZI|nr:hypothetical protein QBC35DRAFT_36578 [Podospora australis]